MTLFVSPSSLIALVVCLSGSPAAAQIVGGDWGRFHQESGALARDVLGASVARTPDANGDGFDDWLVGAPGHRNDHGMVRLVSGKDGQAIYQWFGITSKRLGQSVAAAGDVDGDGVPDFIAASPKPGLGGELSAVFVYSGASGGVILEVRGTDPKQPLAKRVAGIGDVNGDGRGDLLFGSDLATERNEEVGKASVYSGRTGVALWTMAGQEILDRLGSDVAAAGNLDGDGVPDFVIGARATDPGGLDGAGTVYAYSGDSFSLLWTFDGSVYKGHVGAALAGVGDIDRDGFDDVLVGAPGQSGVGAAAYLLSGRDGMVLLDLPRPSSRDKFGEAVANAGDVDGDGVHDLLIGAPPTIGSTGSAWVYSGASGALIVELVGDQLLGGFGSSVAGLGDLTGTGFGEVIVGAPFEDVGGVADAGTATVFSLDPFLSLSEEEFSALFGGTVRADIDFPSSEAAFSYALLISGTGTGPIALSGVELPLTADAILLRMATGWAPPTLQRAFGRLDQNGDSSAIFFNDPVLLTQIGRTYYMAALSYNPNTLKARRSSVARPLTIVP